MPYNQTTVVLGGLMHIPVIIVVLRFIENRFNKNRIDYKGSWLKKLFLNSQILIYYDNIYN